MRTKVKVFWAALFFIEAIGLFSVFYLIGWWREIPNPPTTYKVFSSFLFASIASAFFLLFLSPVFISQSCMVVKMAIERAFQNDFEKVQMFLSRYWLPVPKCEEIVGILRQLCADRERKPEGISSEFADCIVLDDWGNWVLSWEGKEKMINKVNSGWFTAKKAENLISPRTIKVLLRLIVIVAVIRVIALAFQTFSRH